MVEQNEMLDLVFHAMADATRRQLLQRIIIQSSSVLKLAEPFNFSLNAISKHLKVLEKAGLVKRNKKGREHFFAFNSQALEYADALISQLKHDWEERLDALEYFLTTKNQENLMSSKLIVKKLINASFQDVFDAWSQPEMLKKWFYPDKPGWKAISTLEFKVGGHYRHEMIHEMGQSFVHTGIYKEIVPHKKIVFTWNSHAVTDTLVTVELKPMNGKTEVTITHELISDEVERRQHQEGWHSCLSHLTKFFSNQNYQCSVSFCRPINEVYQALTSEAGLKGWWTRDCTVKPIQVSAENTFRFGPTFTVMRIKEFIPNKKIVWECINHHFVNPDLTKLNEWIGTKLTFQLDESPHDKSTHLHFTQEGLTPMLECFSICENRWDYFLKDSLKSYLETGLGAPHQE